MGPEEGNTMTKVNIISGFLGAGKTTLIKKLISEAFQGQKVILLENEYGEVGVDGAFMKESGIQITELNSGCICCTLAGDFEKAVDELMEQYHPDRLVVEPTGVGKLSDIRRAVEGLKDEHDLVIEGCATVVDAGKCRMYMKNFGEFFNDQIKSAETIVLSRTQLLPPERVEKAVTLITEQNPQARIITTPWDELTGETILGVIEHPDVLLEMGPGEEHHHHDEDEDEDEHEHEHHEHHHHDHDDHDGDEHEHHHDHDEDEDEHHHEHDEHEHHHDHEHEHHHHHHHHHPGEHDADEVFDNIGVTTIRKVTEEGLRAALAKLDDEEVYGNVLRAKGILPTEDGRWIHFDYVPGEMEIRYGAADYTGRVCVIGANLDKEELSKLLGI